MRRRTFPGALRPVLWVVLVLVVVAPCLQLAAGAGPLHLGSKHVHRPSVPWASATAGVTLGWSVTRHELPALAHARLPLIVRSPFVPPEA